MTILKIVLIRFVDKLKWLMPIIIGGFIVGLILLLFIKALSNYLPDQYHQFLQLIESNSWEENKSSLKIFFDSYGNDAWKVFVLLQTLQVILAPIPGQITGLFGGFLFGFSYGLFLTMIGLTIGSTIAITFSRFLGIKIVRRFVNVKIINKFDYLISKGGAFNFFMIFLLPALPDDAICFIAGLTKISIPKLILACILGRFPGMAVLSFAGASVDSNIQIAQIVFSICLFLSLFIWLFDKELENYFYNLSKQWRSTNKEESKSMD